MSEALLLNFEPLILMLSIFPIFILNNIFLFTIIELYRTSTFVLFWAMANIPIMQIEEKNS